MKQNYVDTCNRGVRDFTLSGIVLFSSNDFEDCVHEKGITNVYFAT